MINTHITRFPITVRRQGRAMFTVCCHDNILRHSQLQLLYLLLHRRLEITLFHRVLHEECLEDKCHKDAERQTGSEVRDILTKQCDCDGRYYSYLMMMMTTTMWKSTKKILAASWVTAAKPLLSSGHELRNNFKNTVEASTHIK